MKNFLANQAGGKKAKGYFIAFLVFLLCFLAVGLATLGSTQSVGNAYELRHKQTGDQLSPSVTFELKNPSRKKDGDFETVDLRLVAVYVDIAVIYG